MAFKRDNNELLLFMLKQLAQDQMAFQRNRYGTEQDVIEISEKDLADKVRFLGCHTHLLVWSVWEIKIRLKDLWIAEMFNRL